MKIAQLKRDVIMLKYERDILIGSDRTTDARRGWHALLVKGEECRLRRIERLMQSHRLKARLPTPAAAGSR